MKSTIDNMGFRKNKSLWFDCFQTITPPSDALVYGTCVTVVTVMMVLNTLYYMIIVLFARFGGMNINEQQ